MKPKQFLTLAAAAVMLLPGCVRAIDETADGDSPAAETITLPVTGNSSETVQTSEPAQTEPPAESSSDTEISTVTEITSAAVTSAITETSSVSETEIAENPKIESCADIIKIFGGDAVSGYLGSDMKEVLNGISDGYDVKKLSAGNISAAAESGETYRTFFGFTLNGTEGIIPVESGGETYYAVRVTADDGTEYTAVFGNSASTSPEEAEKYLNTCTRADYLAICADAGGSAVLMPVAAGNHRDGIYAVLPNIRLLGYDTGESEPFSGLTYSYNISVTRTEYDATTETLSLFYETDNSFPGAIFFRCDDIYIGGEYIPVGYDNFFPLILYSKGCINLKCPEPEAGDIYYFKGTVYNEETREPICDAGIAAYNK